MSDPYSRIVRYYDAENADRVDDIPFTLDLTERFGDPVLIAGCGTGRLAFPLARLGLRVVGVDVSEAMLERARSRGKALQIRPQMLTWHTSDITALHLDEHFPLAIFPYNGFMHLLEAEQQQAALERLYAHLAPGGALVIDVHNPVELFRYDDLPQLVLERTFSDAETGQMVMQQSALSIDHAEQIMEITWVYDRLGEAGQVFRDVVPMRLRLTFAAEFRLLLSQAGFREVEMYGDYEGGPYSEDSPRLIIEAFREEAS